MPPTSRSIRIAARAVLVHEDRLLLVNAWPASRGSELWCAPGGGAEAHDSLPANLAREVHEETGLRIEVGAPCLVNEFHSPRRRWHQVEIFFRCQLLSGTLDDSWKDPEGVVTSRRWFTRAELGQIRHRPGGLEAVAWQDAGAPTYDPLELLAE